ncbi:molecular chaperone [Serratia fonticola]|uniref:fimbrial biogenesis chaperone n=1 Tax=Serratia fonticola TaxID=47917 RepID=UPI00301DF688
MKKMFGVLLLALGLAGTAQANDAPGQPNGRGVWLTGTRIVYHEGDKSQSQVLNNGAVRAYLIQALMEDKDKKSTALMTATPPLFRMEKQGVNTLRIIGSPGLMSLPRDRETVFYLGVKAIPSTQAGDESVSDKMSGKLLISTLTRIKVFYRPAGLTVPRLHAGQQLQFTRQGDGISVKNPTPYYISLAAISVDGKRLVSLLKDPDPMIAPFAQRQWAVSGAVKGAKVEWTDINDEGGSEKEQGVLQ